MSALPSKPVSILEFLRQFFGCDLSELDLERLSERTPEKFDALRSYYFDYIDLHGDFLVPAKKTGEIRPLLWGAISNGGDFLGGAPPHVLKQAILLYDSVLITEPLHFGLSGFNLDWWKTRHHRPSGLVEYLRFLSVISPLVEASIVNIVSDRAAFRTVRSLREPRGPDNWFNGFEDEALEAFITKGAPSVLFDAELPHRYPEILGYLQLADHYNADIATNNYSNDWILSRCLDYWQVVTESPVRPLKVAHDLRLDLSGTNIADIITMRRDEELFQRFRIALADAIGAEDEQAFRERLSDLIASFNVGSKRILPGYAKQTALAFAGLAIDQTIAKGAEWPVWGTMAGLAIGSIESHIQTALENRRRKRSGAVIRLSLGLIQ